MEERREFVRLDARVEVSFQMLPEGEAKRSMTKNISGGGICFFSDEVLQPGTHMRGTVKLPEQQEPLNFTAEVVWSAPYEVIGGKETWRGVEIGVRFINISREDQDALTRYVSSSSTRRAPNF